MATISNVSTPFTFSIFMPAFGKGGRYNRAEPSNTDVHGRTFVVIYNDFNGLRAKYDSRRNVLM
jgi:hypothetical protein